MKRSVVGGFGTFFRWRAVCRLEALSRRVGI